MTVLLGLAASLLAAFCVAAWLAIGALVLRPRRAPDAFTLAGCIVAGASLTSLAYALSTRVGVIAPAGALISLLSLAAAWTIRSNGPRSLNRPEIAEALRRSVS